MKGLKLILLSVVMFFAYTTVQAQIQVRFNIGVQPQWAPAEYQTDYYYLPDVEAYYDVQNSMFIYYEGSSWIRRSYLPVRYRNYDLYHGYKVSMRDYHGNTPYYNHRVYRERYSNGRNRIAQRSMGDRPSNYRSKDFNNQSNRNRVGSVNRHDGDRNYNRQGNQRIQRSQDNQTHERIQRSQDNHRQGNQRHERK